MKITFKEYLNEETLAVVYDALPPDNTEIVLNGAWWRVFRKRSFILELPEDVDRLNRNDPVTHYMEGEVLLSPIMMGNRQLTESDLAGAA